MGKRRQHGDDDKRRAEGRMRQHETRRRLREADPGKESRDSGHLADSIEQVEPGGITFGDAFYWQFLEKGTARMAPRPFVAPAMKRIRTPARKDAGERAVKLIQRGR